ncbi:hypothetical protein AAHC03_022802 [Spirometra sp. Aus1]
MASHLVSTLLFALTVSAWLRRSSDLNPRDLTVEVLGPTSVKLSWKPPKGPTNGTPVYNIRLGKEFRAITNATTITISDLRPSTKYKFSVQTIIEEFNLVMPGIDAIARTANLDPNKAFSAGYRLWLSFPAVILTVISYL